MTVAELIEVLKDLDGDMEVRVKEYDLPGDTGVDSILIDYGYVVINSNYRS